MAEDELVDSITNSADMSLSKLWEIVKNREALCAKSMGSQRVRHDGGTEQQQRLVPPGLTEFSEPIFPIPRLCSVLLLTTLFWAASLLHDLPSPCRASH